MAKPEQKLLLQQLTCGDRLGKFITNTEKLGADNLTFDVLNTRLELLEKYWTEAINNDTQLNSYIAELVDDAYFIEDKFSEFENSYVLAKSYLVGKVSPFLEQAQQRLPTHSNQPTPGVLSMRSSVPTLKRPTFSGNQADWENFKENFTAMFKNDTTMMPSLKFQHLISCLEGDAARRIANFQVSGSNFEVAWDALCRRYDNKRLRLATQLNSAINCPPVSKRSVSEFSRLLDTMAQSIRALKLLARPVEHWDDWFVQLIVTKLDASTREDWEKSLEGSDDFPTYKQLISFLENRIKSLDAARSNDPSINPGRRKPNSSYTKPMSSHHSSNSTNTKAKAPQCVLCGGAHYLNNCQGFLQSSVASRRQTATHLRLCFNCLRKDHTRNNCNSKYKCKSCGSSHHTLLHEDTADSRDVHSNTSAHTVNMSVDNRALETHSQTAVFGRNALLGTAIIVLSGKAGDEMKVRALIDPCSEGSFISQKVVQSLKITRSPHSMTVSGVGGQVTAQVSSIAHLTLISLSDSNFTLSFSAAVLPKLTQLLPQQRLERLAWPQLTGLRLADPSFNTPAAIDCILGADVYPHIILAGLRVGKPGSPIAHQTRLGWILTGQCCTSSSSSPTTSFSTTLSAESSLASQLRQFWEIEEATSTKQKLNVDEQACEQHFQDTHSRDSSGRYVVHLPLKQQPTLPGSRQHAVRRLIQVERRLQQDMNLRLAYNKFMKEYEDLQHMRRITHDQVPILNTSYIPHHAVVRPETGKLRVVFDAAHISGDHCLNDYLHAGPKLQADIFTILTRWRVFKYVFTADVVKMFRQILVHPEDVKWQRIVWRHAPEEPIADYELLTVTYGTSCAPYLANRVLRQLALDEQTNFPVGANIILKHTYVDDALAGAHNLVAAYHARRELINLLATAGMSLDKWSANFSLPTNESAQVAKDEYNFKPEDTVSILGLHWAPRSDTFSYRVQPPVLPEVITKRIILSNIAKLYDPSGWLAPVIVRAKILLQQLWITGKDWDTAVDSETRSLWLHYCSQLPKLQGIAIPRWFGTTDQSSIILNGFCDASEKAYAAAVYVVVKTTDATRSTLMCAKSKVAPIKTISLPRLELCGALLLAKLISRLVLELDLKEVPLRCWSDSQVVLAWLNEHPSHWKTFIANRTSEILTLLPNAQWRHVASNDNPADLATRGLSPENLSQQHIWWHGPPWLILPDKRDVQRPVTTTTMEKRGSSTVVLVTQPHQDNSIYGRFSSWTRMLRVMSYVHRWKHRTRRTQYNSVSLSAEELQKTQNSIIKTVQREVYSTERLRLQAGNNALHGSTLRNLKPFLDKHDVLRVGGRLQLSCLPYDEKHPVILPGKHYVTELLIRHAHAVTLHGGPQLTQSYLRRAFWITSARVHIKTVIRKCVRCIRHQGRTLQQQMAPLPAARVTPSRAFSFTGVDYAGPFPVRATKGRGHKATKGYVAVFTCMVTRAVHLEVVSDYSTQTFLAAFDRFVSRRGLCHTVYSDNGTTFRGADTELKRMFDAASRYSAEVAASVANKGIRWQFIPPRAPHFGGLWEAAVKSFKHHLKRVIGDATLTFEEFSTLTSRIEASLNSRPLSAISSDPTDFTALTPGHFLIGASLQSPPDAPSILETSGLSRWQTVMNMRNHFWQRWRKEVIQDFQQRSKWHDPNPPPRVGDLVLIADDGQPAQHWPLARISEVHPGPDGLTRVLTLRTATSPSLKRPIHRIVPLPVNDEATSAFISSSTGSMTAGGKKEE